MSFLEQIVIWEKEVFLAINGSSSPFLDSVMWLFSGSIMWMPIAVFFLFTIVYKKKYTEWLPVLIAIGLVVLFCDSFSSGLCKPYFGRLRPTHHPLIKELVDTVYGYRGGKFGFISGHATNFFGFAMLTACIFKNKTYTITIFIWAALIAYSRVYLGVHFISDVVAGAACGSIIGFLTYRIYLFMVKRGKTRIACPISKASISGRNIALGLLCNTAVFTAFSPFMVTHILNK